MPASGVAAGNQHCLPGQEHECAGGGKAAEKAMPCGIPT